MFIALKASFFLKELLQSGFTKNQRDKRNIIFYSRYFEQDKYFGETNKKFGNYCK